MPPKVSDQEKDRLLALYECLASSDRRNLMDDMAKKVNERFFDYEVMEFFPIEWKSYDPIWQDEETSESQHWHEAAEWVCPIGLLSTDKAFEEQVKIITDKANQYAQEGPTSYFLSTDEMENSPRDILETWQTRILDACRERANGIAETIEEAESQDLQIPNIEDWEILANTVDGESLEEEFCPESPGDYEIIVDPEKSTVAELRLELYRWAGSSELSSANWEHIGRVLGILQSRINKR